MARSENGGVPEVKFEFFYDGRLVLGAKVFFPEFGLLLTTFVAP